MDDFSDKGDPGLCSMQSMADGNSEIFPIRVLELRSVRGPGGGPEKTILLGTARTDAQRFDVTICYMRDLRDSVFQMHERARDIGVTYAEVLERHSFDPGVWPQLTRLVRERRIDIVHAHDYKSDFIAWLLARSTSIIPMATVHGWIRNSWREKVYYGLDTRLLKRFPAVVTVSGPIRETLLKRGAAPERVHRIPNGIDQQAFRRVASRREEIRGALGIGDNDFVLGAVGRLEPEKRFDLLLTIAARLSMKPRVLIVGEGSSRAAIEAQAQGLGIATRVSLTGLRSDVLDLLHAFDVYVQTSDTEGVPNAVLEAMATEVPVVATDVGGTSEVVTDDVHGLLVPRGDVAALTAAVERTHRDAVATSRRSRAAREHVERDLSFDARMARVERIYVDLVARRRAVSGNRRR
jgi:glycosyltransferase involved in cell wall biosynthesis